MRCPLFAVYQIFFTYWHYISQITIIIVIVPHLNSGLGRLLHLPSAEVGSVWIP